MVIALLPALFSSPGGLGTPSALKADGARSGALCPLAGEWQEHRPTLGWAI